MVSSRIGGLRIPTVLVLEREKERAPIGGERGDDGEHGEADVLEPCRSDPEGHGNACWNGGSELVPNGWRCVADTNDGSNERTDGACTWPRNVEEEKWCLELTGRTDGSIADGRKRNVQVAATNDVMMWESLRLAVEEEMERDPTVCIMGEDVGHYGGSYKVTLDHYKKFGDLRVLDTPICENGFMGMGIGAAMTGLRPIVEGMNMGFLLLAFNQISNNSGMLHYTSGGHFKVPIVIRGPGGVGRQLGAEHSQRLESYFQSIPGVQLVACSTPRNAKALLKAAIRSDNPIIFFEHVLLYNLKGPVGDADEVQCLEKAEMVREGKDLTILTYSRMRYVVEQAVKAAVAEGYDPEVIDLISIKPFDMGTIAQSVKKTHRVLIVEECMRSGGIGASLSAVINENFLDDLDHQVVRLSSQDVPTPYARTLEDCTIVQAADVEAAIKSMVPMPTRVA